MVSSSGADMAGQFAGSGQGFVLNGFGADMAGRFCGSGQGFVVNGSGVNMAGGLRKRSGSRGRRYRGRNWFGQG